MVKSVASIAIQTATVSVNTKEVPGLRIGFYSDTLLPVLGLPKPFTQQGFEAQNVILSSQFWHQHTNSGDISLLSMHYLNQALPIAGVAPASMDKIGNFQVDLWLPDRYLLLDVPQMFAENPTLYINSKTDRYGFALLKQAVPIDQLQQAYSTLKIQTPRPQGGFVDSQFTSWIIDGVELKPVERDMLHKQAWILLILMACFGFIVFSGIVSAYLQHGIVRQSEMQLKLALGGDKKQLIIQLFNENIPAFFALVVVAPLLGYGIGQYVNQIPVYRSYFEGGLSFNLGLWAAAVAISVTLYWLCSQIPMLGIMTTQFSRGRHGQISKTQKRMGQLTLIAQLTVIISVIILCLVLSVSEWTKYQKISVPTDLYSYEPKVTSPLSLALTTEQIEGQWQVDGKSIALSSAMFTALGDQDLQYKTLNNPGVTKPVNSLYVSSNFFDLLGITALTQAKLTATGLIVNKTMAMQLADELGMNHWRDVQGTTLNVSGFYYQKQLTVQGIIDDQLHFGLNQSTTPVMYLHLSIFNPLFAHRIAPVFYSRTTTPELTASRINDWASLQSPHLTYVVDGSLEQQIVNTNSAGKLLFITSFAMAVMIGLLVIFTLYYRFHFGVKVQQLKLAILLAVGGQKTSLTLQIIKLNIVLMCIAVLCSAVLLFSLDEYTIGLLGVSMLQPILWCCAVIFCSLLIVTITFLATKRILRHSISRLLQG
ncbi:hypothetical protein GCM10009411_02140 [Shewanella litoralis]|uniref:ABC3 transporter permease C-terminal domain-containing protein n=2 Tax=Shewanella litoralis TaxID=2282700 RepID=A0ABQ2R243_9GAMM|nr:hypothetical protein GCM10009411_02140 [Shewanella litoralis]